MADHAAKVLNDLIETSKNGEKGFMAAADDTKNPELRTLFQRHAQECAAAATELQAIVSSLGATPESGGSVMGAVHRGWVNLKSAVAGRTDVAILEECERGEDVAKKQYADALNETLPADIRLIVQRQYDGVLRNHDEIRALRDRYRAQA